MQGIAIKVRLLSPLLLSSNSGDPNMVSTYSYIPARALRGLFAGEFIKRFNLGDNAHKDKTFYNWFLKGDLKFTDAHILIDDNLCMPIPFSIQKEKRKNRIYNLLSFDENLFEKETKIVGGYGLIKEDIIYKKPVNISLNFHHARDREKGVSKEGIIFNYESIDQGQSFGFIIFGEEFDLKKFKETFQDGIYYLGRSKNNQYGKVKLEFNNISIPSLKKQNLKPGELVITFLTDTIIYNGFGFSIADVSELENILGCEIKKSFISTGDYESYISKWKMRTPSEISFTAGSTFLIEVKDEQKLNYLKELQKKGLGERTEEGFGRFIIYENDVEEYSIKDKRKEPAKPKTTIPELLKQIVLESAKKEIINFVISLAIKKAENVEIGKISSLIGRLILILKGSKDCNEFKENLKKLRKIARDKLEDCRVESNTLFEFLISFKIKKEVNFSNLSGRLNVLREETQIIDPLEDEYFIERLSFVYLHNFLTILLKEAKNK